MKAIVMMTNACILLVCVRAPSDAAQCGSVAQCVSLAQQDQVDRSKRERLAIAWTPNPKRRRESQKEKWPIPAHHTCSMCIVVEVLSASI